MPRRKRTQHITVSSRSCAFVLPPATQADIDAALAEWRSKGKPIEVLLPLYHAALPLYTVRCAQGHHHAIEFDGYEMEV